MLIGIDGVNLLMHVSLWFLAKLDVWSCFAVMNPIGPEIVTLTMSTLLTLW